MKQQIVFNGGTYLDNFDGNVLISSADSVYELRPIPWEKQLETLLNLKKVNEALDLSHNWREAGLSQQKYNEILMKVKLKAAFIELSLKHFEETKHLLIESNADILELLDLYTGLLPHSLKPNDSSNYFSKVFCQPIDETNEDFEDYKLFLLQFLQQLYSDQSSQYKSREIEINCGLISLYLDKKCYSENLLKMLSQSNIKLDSEWVLMRLKQTDSYQALALYYSANESTCDEAIDIWIKLETGVYSDESYPGLHCLADFLSSLDSEQIIFKYMDFVLERDQKLGAKILINRKLSENISTAEKLVRHLHKYPEAEQIYLENLIFKMKIRVNFQIS